MPAKTAAPETLDAPPVRSKGEARGRGDPFAGLDPLAAELLRLQAKGKTYRQIAALFCKVQTVGGREVKREPATVDQVKSIIRRARAKTRE